MAGAGIGGFGSIDVIWVLARLEMNERLTGDMICGTKDDMIP